MAEDGQIQGFWHDRCLDHRAADGEMEQPWTGRLAVPEPHPDRPERLENVRAALESEGVVDWETARPATRAELTTVHDPDYLDDLESWSESGGGSRTPTTRGNEATWAAARRAAGAAIQAVEAALVDCPAYAACRPSGHHAQPALAGGFCFLNNAAIAAEVALKDLAVDRVAILDWDVHHGNGTQECFSDRDDVLFVDLHNDHGPWPDDNHPQTGHVDETGTGAGEGYTVNVPLPGGIGDAGYAHAFDRIVEPAVADFEPDLVLCSAGGDAGPVDPLGRNLVTTEGFADIGRRVRRLADEHTDGRLALVQEGGYSLSHVGYAMLATIQGVLGHEPVEDPFAWMPADEARSHAMVDEIADQYDLD